MMEQWEKDDLQRPILPMFKYSRLITAINNTTHQYIIGAPICFGHL